MEDDPFFAPISNTNDLKPVVAKNSLKDDKPKSSKSLTPQKSDNSKFKEKDSRKNDRKHREPKEHEKMHSKRDRSPERRESRDDRRDRVERPPPPRHHDHKYTDPRARLPSMLNDIAFPKPLTINPDAPPNSYKIFNQQVPEIPKLAELYD
ncbi:hypothetical protein TVAG_389650 [Trichomonas vaginalis G3]|uniref:Uncharacterized protein n=1 Tax=Trichomonas vaginalis (strain ATCC PRA-98 / G3) TaxID=412133 RepID=A2E167_TRIV3|nr:hypothetical protein TVAGG3_0938960 [Trichomonas vaginalis G3]EAY13568.1 hypothetical protein TVAG_389650 [Trichomonas vaginalis G3]KAI5486396.1 hypothetical protein TVAGG3_0938960 [Trichomonas vaginalis G3]|eukprot:XP_001325791.1 hypothetical protein [Trichomonas vaginalis G3]